MSKRFYKMAEIGTVPNGFTVRLDGKDIKTPLKKRFIIGTEKLAQKIANEWNQQREFIVPDTMPLTQLVYTMLDKVQEEDRAGMTAEIVKYSKSDLLCYFATHPQDLVERQEKHWRHLLDWLKREFDVNLKTISGIQYLEQAEKDILKFRSVIEELDDVGFTVIQAVTGITGSAVIALAMVKKRIDPLKAFKAACVDEIYQLEKWGHDDIAKRRLNHIESELKAISMFRDLATAE